MRVQAADDSDRHSQPSNPLASANSGHLTIMTAALYLCSPFVNEMEPAYYLFPTVITAGTIFFLPAMADSILTL